MDYSLPMRSLITEVKSRKQYRSLPPVARVFGFIGVLPFIIISVFLYIYYNIYIFLFNILSTSVNYLESWQKKKIEGVAWFAEGIIFLVTLPVIFFFHILLSIISISFFFIWFFMQCNLYIATLGGIRWQPYITKVNAEDTGDGYIASTNRKAGITITIILGIICLADLILYILALFFFVRLAPIATIVDYIYTLTAAITIPLIFKKKLQDAPIAEITEAEDDEDDEDNFMLPTL